MHRQQTRYSLMEGVAVLAFAALVALAVAAYRAAQWYLRMRAAPVPQPLANAPTVAVYCPGTPLPPGVQFPPLARANAGTFLKAASMEQAEDPNRPISAVEINDLLIRNLNVCESPGRLYATMVTAANVLGQTLGRDERQRTKDHVTVQPDVDRHPFALGAPDGNQES